MTSTEKKLTAAVVVLFILLLAAFITILIGTAVINKTSVSSCDQASSTAIESSWTGDSRDGSTSESGVLDGEHPSKIIYAYSEKVSGSRELDYYVDTETTVMYVAGRYTMRAGGPNLTVLLNADGMPITMPKEQIEKLNK